MCWAPRLPAAAAGSADRRRSPLLEGASPAQVQEASPRPTPRTPSRFAHEHQEACRERAFVPAREGGRVMSGGMRLLPRCGPEGQRCGFSTDGGGQLSSAPTPKIKGPAS
ncbi:hypothetical protein HOK021_73360 [Streptomyces hygroscopicus]|nr:hypothetical protein HOK021_73360 [Streptomyces hygroscopicus]